MKRLYKLILVGAMALPALCFAKNANACDQFGLGKMNTFRETLKDLERTRKFPSMEKPWNDLVALKCPLLPTDYALGGTAVRWQGDIVLAIQYYEKSTTPEEVAKLKAKYTLVLAHGRLAPPAVKSFVNINPGSRILTTEESATSTRIRDAIAASGSYSGYVLPGRYRILGKELDLKAGETVEVKVP